MNKKHLMWILLLVVVIFAAGITHSYYIDKKEKVNVICSGSSEIKILENYTAPKDGIQTGKTYTKEVKVKNLKAESWIRIRIEVNNSENENKIRLNFNNDGTWKKYSDGYYYYTRPLKCDEVTTYIFNSVTALDNIKPGELKVICYAESIQAEGHKEGMEPYLNAFKSIQ